MIDKKLILLLFVMAIYIYIARPLTNEIGQYKAQLFTLNNLIAKEKFIHSNTSKILNVYPSFVKKLKEDNSLFFSASSSTSSNFSAMQNIIKKAIIKNNIKLVRINWGEPIKAKGYIKLPISFMVIGNPYNMRNFLKQLLYSQKLMRFEMINIVKYYRGEKITINAIIVGYKLNEKKS